MSLPLSSPPLLPSPLCLFLHGAGVRSAKDTMSWLSLMKDELGDEWTQPDLFRIGASSLLADIERQLYHYCNGKYAAGHKFAMS